MIAVLTFVAISIVPDADVEFGYGRVANRVGKPSFEIVRLRAGIATEDSLRVGLGVAITVPTTLPTSVGLQAEVSDEHSNIWAQLELGYASENFIAGAACGWWIFGAEIQLRNTSHGSDFLVFGKVSFSVVSIYELFNNREEENEDERYTAERP